MGNRALSDLPKCESSMTNSLQPLLPAWVRGNVQAMLGGPKVSTLSPERNLDFAMRRYNQAWLLNPSGFKPYWGIARVLMESGRPDESQF